MQTITVNDLSQGFLEAMADGNPWRGDHPVVQVLNARCLKQNPADKRYRFRISDGVSTFSGCINQSHLTNRMESDGIERGNVVIRLTKYSPPDIAERNENGVIWRVPLVVIDYEVVARNVPLLGNPATIRGTEQKEYQTQHQNLNIRSSTNQVSAANDPGEPPRRMPQVQTSYQPRNLTVDGPVQSGSHFQQSAQQRLPSSPIKPNIAGMPPPRGPPNIHSNVTPIRLITPYVNRWRICGVVTAKTEIQDTKSTRGEFKVFKFELTDEEGGTILIVCWAEMADKCYPLIQIGSMYYVSGGIIKQAAKRFNTTGHDYEISLRADSEITPCMDRAKIAQPRFVLNVVPLSSVASHAEQSVDVIGVIDKVNDIVQLVSKKGEPLQKRDLELIDQSGTIVNITLWGQDCHKYDQDALHQTMGIKGAFVKEFNGSYNLSIGRSSRVELNPECNETVALYTWYNQARPSVQASTISRPSVKASDYARDLHLVGTASDLGLGRDEERGAYFNVTGIISSVKADGALYKSCGTNGCKKKVVEAGNQYRCEKCNLTLGTYKYVLLLQMEVADFSGTHWITVFEDVATRLLGKSAEEIGRLLDSDNLPEYNNVFTAVRFREYTFRIRAKNEFFNEAQKIKWTAFSIEPVAYDRYTEELKKAISEVEDI